MGFISQKDGFDLTTPMGRLMFQMLGAFAEFERNIIAERIRAGLRTAKLKGHTVARVQGDYEVVRVKVVGVIAIFHQQYRTFDRGHPI